MKLLGSLHNRSCFLTLPGSPLLPKKSLSLIVYEVLSWASPAFPTVRVLNFLCLFPEAMEGSQSDLSQLHFCRPHFLTPCLKHHKHDCRCAHDAVDFLCLSFPWKLCISSADQVQVQVCVACGEMGKLQPGNGTAVLSPLRRHMQNTAQRCTHSLLSVSAHPSQVI